MGSRPVIMFDFFWKSCRSRAFLFVSIYLNVLGVSVFARPTAVYSFMNNRREQNVSGFEVAFQANSAAVFHFLRRLLTNPEDVEDCVQETFLRFWRSNFEFEEPRQIKAFIFKIARNLAIDQLRRRTPIRMGMKSIEEMPPLEAQSRKENRLEQQELADKVREKVNQLPESQKETFVLFRYHGLTYQEIAEIQGVSVKTIDSRLYRAMKWLGRNLSGISSQDFKDKM